MKNKKGLAKKAFSFAGIFVLVVAILAIAGVYAQVSGDENNGDVSDNKEKEVVGLDEEYVKDFVKNKGISEEDINDIEEVSFGDLPDDVSVGSVENMGNANVAIFKVGFNDTKDGEEIEENVYVVTYSTKEVATKGDVVFGDVRQFLNFGLEEESNGENFLDSATGVPGSLERGYVMMRAGSITGVSTNLEIVNSSEGIVELVLYKNGEEILFGNSFSSDSSGVKGDYDVQSQGVVSFRPGDVISAKMRVSIDTGEGSSENQSVGSVSYRNVITLVEITTS